MKDEQLVSILMNCFNGEKYLKEAVDSVFSQTYKNWELVFWDNQSTDNSADIFNSYDDPRLKYYYAPEHTDLGGGRACAWPYLRGDFVAILDTDDVWLPTKLERQIPFFDDSDVGIVISDTLFFNENNEKPLYGKDFPAKGWVFEELLEQYFVSLETVVIRKETALKLDYAFDPEFSFIADFDLVLRMSRISKLALCPEVLAKWRVHGESDTWKYPEAFYEEKNRWVKKLVEKNPLVLEKYFQSISKFQNQNDRTKIILTIVQGDRLLAIKKLLSTNFDHWHSWVLLLLCLLPFSKKILLIYYKRKISLNSIF